MSRHTKSILNWCRASLQELIYSVPRTEPSRIRCIIDKAWMSVEPMVIGQHVCQRLLCLYCNVGNNLRIWPEQFPQLSGEVEHGNGEYVLSVSACWFYSVSTCLLWTARPASGDNDAQYSYVPRRRVAQCSSTSRGVDQQAWRYFIVQV